MLTFTAWTFILLLVMFLSPLSFAERTSIASQPKMLQKGEVTSLGCRVRVLVQSVHISAHMKYLEEWNNHGG